MDEGNGIGLEIERGTLIRMLRAVPKGSRAVLAVKNRRLSVSGRYGDILVESAAGGVRCGAGAAGMRTEIDPGPAADFLQGWKTGYKDAAGTDAIRITPPGSKRYLRMECADGSKATFPAGEPAGTGEPPGQPRRGGMDNCELSMNASAFAAALETALTAAGKPDKGREPRVWHTHVMLEAGGGKPAAVKGTDNHRMISAAVGETGIEHAGVSGTPARVLIPVALAEQFLKTRRDGDADAEAPERLTAATAERGTRVRIEYAGTVWIAHGEGGGGWFPAAPDDRTGCGLKYTSVEVETRTFRSSLAATAAAVRARRVPGPGTDAATINWAAGQLQYRTNEARAASLEAGHDDLFEDPGAGRVGDEIHAAAPMGIRRVGGDGQETAPEPADVDAEAVLEFLAAVEDDPVLKVETAAGPPRLLRFRTARAVMWITPERG